MYSTRVSIQSEYYFPGNKAHFNAELGCQVVCYLAKKLRARTYFFSAVD